jgi:uncharacterized protein (DUF427 family)
MLAGNLLILSLKITLLQLSEAQIISVCPYRGILNYVNVFKQKYFYSEFYWQILHL